MLSPRVACAAYHHWPPPPTTNHQHRSYHHHTKTVGFVPHRSRSSLALPTQTQTHHQQLLMTVDDDLFFSEESTTIMTSEDAGTASESSAFIDEASSSAFQDNVMSDTKSENEVIFDTLLPSTRALFSYKSKSNIMISSKHGRRRDSTVVTPKSVGPSSSALFPSLSSASSSSSSTAMNGSKVEKTSWKDRLVNVSNIASFLCILDCTLLPFFSVVMPALSWSAGAIGGGASGTGFGVMGAILTYLPTLSHGIALYFVIPMGILTSIINYYYGHGEWKFSMFSFAGLILIFIANSSVMGLLGGALGMDVSHLHHQHHHHAHDACGAMVGAATSMIAHSCPPIMSSGGGEGLVHRLTNTLGCVLLLGSNYAGKKHIEQAQEDNASAKGCAASAFSEAWSGGRGGEDGITRSLIVCGCNECGPTYGAGRASGANRVDGGNFFQWKQSSGKRR